MITKGLGFFLSLLASATLSYTSYAQSGTTGDLTPAIEWDKRSNISERLTGLGLDLLGDSIDPHTGSLSFQHTDISLSGNSDLEVALRRQLTAGYFYSLSVDAEFGDWTYDVPRLHVVTADDSPWVGLRCTDPQSIFNAAQYSNASSLDNTAYPVEYSNGLFMDIPGAGSQQVLTRTLASTNVFPSVAEYVTTGNWYLTCGSATDGGEGFVAVAPNGNQYRFDKYISYNHTKLGSVNPDGGNAGEDKNINRKKAMLMATEVTDVHGNWVRYTYDSLNRLTRIHSNDGRSITLAYSAGSNVVASATTNGRTWNYNYTTRNMQNPYVGDFGTNKKILETVTRPDGEAWSFNLSGMHVKPTKGELVNTPGDGEACQVGDLTISLTHPHGVTGTFDLKEIGHRAGHAEWKTVTTTRCSGAFVDPRLPTYYDLYHEPLETMSVTQKTLSGTSIPTSVWSFTYESDLDEPRYPAGHVFEGHPIATSAEDPTNWTKMVDPSGAETTYYHFWNNMVHDATNIAGGKLDRMEIRATAGGTVLETQQVHYEETGQFGGTYIPNNFSDPPLNLILTPHSTGVPIKVSKTITNRDGDTYTSEYAYNATQSSPAYSYGRPIQTTVYSSVAPTTPRVTDTTYIHNKTKWILGLPDVVTQNGREISDSDYTSNGQLERLERYGALYATLGYHPDGTTQYIEDALGYQTQFSSWKRGIPQTITQKDNTTYSQAVDDDGWVTSITDERGYQTDYDHDFMGRLTEIDPPGNIYQHQTTNISYDFSGSGGQAVRQTIQKGDATTYVYYDSLLRPRHVGKETTGWSSWSRTDYDALGRVVYQSRPEASMNSSHYGTRTYYDALGRTTHIEDTADIDVATDFAYLSQNRTQVTNALGHITTQWRDGYGGPGGGDVIQIAETGRNTVLNRNVWGQLESVTQSGSLGGAYKSLTQTYGYDEHQRLCRYYTPEAGETRYDYNPRGEMAAMSKGHPASTGSGLSCMDPSGDTRVDYSYTPRGFTETVDYFDPDTEDITNTYWDDGQIRTMVRGWETREYYYDLLGQATDIYSTRPLGGIAGIDWHRRRFQYVYDGYGNLKSRQHGRIKILFTHDAFGHRTYATSTTYEGLQGGGIIFYGGEFHPDSSLKALTYGYSGVVRSRTLDDFQRTDRDTAAKGSVKYSDVEYDYDDLGRITSITDYADSSRSRTFGYDALNQLTSANNPGQWGAGSYTYDSLGNLTSKTIFGRTVSLPYDLDNRLASYTDGTQAMNVEYVPINSRGNIWKLSTRSPDRTSTHNYEFIYDMSDQPTTIYGGPGGATDFEYDGAFKRYRSRTPQADGTVHMNDSFYGPDGKLVYMQRFRNRVYEGPDYSSSAHLNGQSSKSLELDPSGFSTSSKLTAWGQDKGRPKKVYDRITRRKGPKTPQPGDVVAETGDIDWDTFTLKPGRGRIVGGGVPRPIPTPGKGSTTSSGSDTQKGSFAPLVSSQKSYPSGYGETNHFIYIGNERVARLHKDNQSSTGLTRRYTINDQVGSTSVTFTRWAQVISNEFHSPYGEVDAVDPEQGDRITFAGHVRDEDTQLTYMQARYYAPSIGRFLSVDPVTFMETGDPRYFNRYMYGGNNPVSNVDSDGRQINCRACRYVQRELQQTNNHAEVRRGAAQAIDIATDVAPGVGDVKAIGEAVANPTVGNVVGAGAGLIPGVGEIRGAVRGAEAASDIAKAGAKRHSPEKQALTEMAKLDKKTGGITEGDMDAYKQLNSELPDPYPSNQVRGPESHPTASAPTSQQPHGHVGPVDHIPIRPDEP